jgi:hypothetical protein
MADYPWTRKWCGSQTLTIFQPKRGQFRQERLEAGLDRHLAVADNTHRGAGVISNRASMREGAVNRKAVTLGLVLIFFLLSACAAAGTALQRTVR